MRILLTGASGFLGGRLARLLCTEGHEVIGLYKPGDDIRLVRDLPMALHACDLLDYPLLRTLMRGVEAVFHTAALVTFAPALYRRQMRVNVLGTRFLVNAAEAAGVRRILYTSTVNTLGAPPPGRVGDEGTPFDWSGLNLGYMDSKRAAETLVLGASAPGRLTAICLLPGTFFGPGDLNINAGRYILLVERGLLVAAPPGGTSVVHVDDVARGHLLALDRGVSGSRYVLCGENLAYRALFALIAEELGRPGPRLTIPASALLAAGRLGDRISRNIGRDLPFTLGQATAISRKLYYTSALARDELGYTFRPARIAIREAVAWYREQGLLPPRPIER